MAKILLAWYLLAYAQLLKKTRIEAMMFFVRKAIRLPPLVASNEQTVSTPIRLLFLRSNAKSFSSSKTKEETRSVRQELRDTKRTANMPSDPPPSPFAASSPYSAALTWLDQLWLERSGSGVSSEHPSWRFIES